ncbi:MAG: dephospho-CoA kinase [Desulfobulbaceae bacterium]|nr:dephospho-CoA kinase [Desulfobulbaceae bacterium]
MNTPQAIAITGGIGSGKSRVSRWLAEECHLPLYSADEEVRQLLEPGGQGWHYLRAWLGSEYFTDDGGLLKAKLRQAIFNDVLLRRRVEHDLHPLVLDALNEKISQSGGACLVEVPLLYEVQWQGRFDSVLLVYADEAVCRARVMARDGVSEDQVNATIRAQIPLAQKRCLADYTIDNSGSWFATLAQLEDVKIMLQQNGMEKKLDSSI